MNTEKIFEMMKNIMRELMSPVFLNSPLWTGLQECVNRPIVNSYVMKQKQKHTFLTCHRVKCQPTQRERMDRGSSLMDTATLLFLIEDQEDIMLVHYKYHH